MQSFNLPTPCKGQKAWGQIGLAGGSDIWYGSTRLLSYTLRRLTGMNEVEAIKRLLRTKEGARSHQNKHIQLMPQACGGIRAEGSPHVSYIIYKTCMYKGTFSLYVLTRFEY